MFKVDIFVLTRDALLGQCSPRLAGAPCGV
jgi:hypothetical protein